MYPKIYEYHGGGSIYNKHTSIRNLLTECPPNLVDEVFHLIKEGNEVIIQGGEIKAVGDRFLDLEWKDTKEQISPISHTSNSYSKP